MLLKKLVTPKYQSIANGKLVDNMSLINASLIIIGIFTFLLAAIVFWRNHQSIINKSLTLFLSSVGLWSFAISFFQITKDLQFLYLWSTLIYISVIFVPSLFVLFAYALTQKKSPPSKQLLLITLAPLLFVALLLLPGVWIKQIQILPTEKIITLGPVYLFWMVYYLAFIIWGFLLVWKKFHSSKGIVKLQMRLVLIGLLFPSIGAIIPNIILPLFRNFRWIALGPIFLTPMNVIITYAIIKHRFMDIRVIIARSISYTVLIIFLGLFYSSLLFLLSTYVQIGDSRTMNILITTVIALFIAYTFQPLQDYFGKITDNIFYKDRYSTDVLLHSLSQSMALTRNLNKLSDKLLTILREQMKISWGSFIIGSDIHYLSLRTQPESHKKKLTREILKKLIAKDSSDKMVIYEELKEGHTKQRLRDLSIAIVVPMVTKNQIIGSLLLGEKSSGEPYYAKDLNLLNIVGPEFAVALQNAQRYEEIKNFNITLQDEVKKATKDLRQALRHLQDLDKLKDEFISIASHELRTPASIMKNYLYMILKQEKDLPQHIYHRLQRVYETNEREIKLINDMLDVSKIESKRINLKPTNFNITELAQRAVEELYPKAEEKKVYVKLNTHKTYIVTADSDKIHQVISNLIDNAIKFTPKDGKITLSIFKEGEMIKVNISDTGIGVSKDNLTQLFTKFGKLDVKEAEFTETPGSGLGLYICNLLINISGGKIWFDSELGKGSTVSFTLPAA